MTNPGEEKMVHTDPARVRFAILVTIGAMLFGMVIGVAIIFGLGPRVQPLDELLRWGVFASEALMIVPVVFVLYRYHLPLAANLRLTPILPVTVRDSVALGLGLAVLMDEFDRLVAGVFPMPDNLGDALAFLQVSTPLDMLIVVGGTVLIGPLVEELIFRGYLQRQLEIGFQDTTKAVLVSAAFFTLVHFNIWWGLQIYILGVVLGYLVWRTGSVWPAIIVHGLNNGHAVLLTNISEENFGWYQWGDHVSPLWIMAAGFLVYIGFRSFLYNNPEPGNIYFEEN